MKRESNSVDKELKPSLMTRRRLLGLAAITSCGVAGIFISRRKESSAETIVASSTETTLPTTKEAKVSPQRFDGPQSFYYSTKPVKGIPQAWVDKQGLDVLRYANFIQDLGLKNITPYHILYPHFKTRGRTNNSIPLDVYGQILSLLSRSLTR